MKIKITPENFFAVIIALCLFIAIAAAPVQAVFGSQVSESENMHSQGHDSVNSSGMSEMMAASGSGTGIQTTLPLIYGLFALVILLILVVIYIVFVKLRQSNHLPIKESQESAETAQGDIIKTAGGFPQELSSLYSNAVLVGNGGLSSVYSAKSVKTGETVALKIPHLKDEASGKIFLQEIKIWEGLDNPNIVKIRSVNIFPVPYVEMDYIPDSLESINTPVDPEISLIIESGILRGLSYAHSRGIIHCDIKPGNILIDSRCTFGGWR